MPEQQSQADPQSQMRTQVETILRGANLPEDTAAQAWDSFWASDKPDAFRSGMNGVEKLPSNIKLQLMQLRFPEAASRVPQPHAEQPSASQPLAAPQMIPGASPGSEHRPKDLPPLPSEYRPTASGLFSTLTAPLTEQLDLPTFKDAARAGGEEVSKKDPPWMQPVDRFLTSAKTALGGAMDQMTSPLSILMAGTGFLSEGAGMLPGAVRAGTRAVGAIGGASSGADAAKHIYKFFQSGDTGNLGKAAVDTLFSVMGLRAGFGKRGKAPSNNYPSATIVGESEEVTPPEFNPAGPPRLGEGSPDPKRLGSGPQRRMLEAPSQQRDAVEAIARTSGPFKPQVYEWARKPLGEIAKLRQNALDAFEAVQRQARSETAPFPEGPTPVSNLSKNVPDTSKKVPGTATGSRVPTGKGDFTPGGRRVLEDRARSQYEALDKLFRMKAEESGLILPEFPAQAGGRPSREALGGRREIAGPTPSPKPPAGLLPGPSGAHETPPGAIRIGSPGLDYRFPVPQAGESPMSRQLAEPELRVFSPDATLDQNVQTARSLPPEILERNIEQMRVAAAEHASQMLKAAGKDQDKLADVKTFIEQAKDRLDRFQGVYDELSGAKPNAAPTRKLEAVKTNGKPKAQAEEAPTPESVGKKLVPGVRRESMKAKAAGNEGPPASKAVDGLKREGNPVSNVGPRVGPKSGQVVELPKREGTIARMDRERGKSASGDLSNPPVPEPEINSAEAGTIAQHIGDQINTAKSQGFKIMRLTIPRGEGKKPLVIGVNPDIDTPEELAATIVRSGGASGMATMESTDPERPVSWKFLIGEPPGPPR